VKTAGCTGNSFEIYGVAGDQGVVFSAFARRGSIEESRRLTARWEMASTVLSFGLRFPLFIFLLCVSWLIKGRMRWCMMMDHRHPFSFRYKIFKQTCLKFHWQNATMKLPSILPYS
jgi:hypothetical protein